MAREVRRREAWCGHLMWTHLTESRRSRSRSRKGRFGTHEAGEKSGICCSLMLMAVGLIKDLAMFGLAL